MAPSEAFYDVYNSPRINPVQFGDFFAGDHAERETLLQGAKYVRRAHRARAWFAREAITNFFISPSRKIGELMAALDEAKLSEATPSFSDEKRADASASAECLDSFIKMANKLSLSGKELLPLDGDQYPIKVGGVPIHIDLACLVRSVDKSDAERVGGIFLNTQKGKGLGARDDTKKKRDKAGEAIAIMVLKRLQDEFSDLGEPLHEDAIHIYARGKHFWAAPKAYVTKLKNIDAAGRILATQWPTVKPPSDFDPANSKFHD